MSASRQSCGTAWCIARRTALLRGWEPTYAIGSGDTASMVFKPDGRVVHVESSRRKRWV